MDKRDILPPGQHPHDPAKQDVDPIAHALERTQTMLLWIDEHRAPFEKLRQSYPDQANSELAYLKDATEQAVLHLQRLTELILGGYAIDPQKSMPKGLCCEPWLRFVQYVLAQHVARRQDQRN